MSYSTLERAVLHRLAATAGRVTDLAYAALVHQLGITQRFFPDGFGNLDVIKFHEDIERFISWPPPHFADVSLQWQHVDEGSVSGAAYDVYKAAFPTPCDGRIYDVLPPESRTAHALWVAPRNKPDAPTVLHLAATGDHGYARRQNLGLPLVAQGVGTLALESPFYGVRKPAGQQGAKLRRVSDLLLLGRATIEESLFLLQWLAGEGHQRLGVCGLSMGGVHATMVASLYPAPVALAPLLAPRSAASAYTTGALYHATAWEELRSDREAREAELVAAVEAAARANEKLAGARVKALQAAAVQAAGAAAEAEAVAAVIVAQAVGGGGSPSLEVPSQGGPASGVVSPASAAWRKVGSWLARRGAAADNLLRRVRRLEGADRHAAAVALMEAVLECWTDVTRFPRPQRPDAAVLVGATEDAYVVRQSVEELAQHLPGSETRWVPGGHVTSFLLHQSAFRAAIVDSLGKL